MAISIAHEHFISYLIKQKLLLNTEKLQIQEPTRLDKTFVLYLPENELHELGLMYVNYEVQFSGYKTIYLGESVPIESLKDVKKYFDNITFICYMTVEPNPSEINDYVREIKKELLIDDSNFWISGRMIEHIDPKLLDERLRTFATFDDLAAAL
jgi:hypothetical protein